MRVNSRTPRRRQHGCRIGVNGFLITCAISGFAAALYVDILWVRGMLNGKENQMYNTFPNDRRLWPNPHVNREKSLQHEIARPKALVRHSQYLPGTTPQHNGDEPLAANEKSAGIKLDNMSHPLPTEARRPIWGPNEEETGSRLSSSSGSSSQSRSGPQSSSNGCRQSKHTSDFTLVSQLSLDRAGNIRGTCNRWRGPIIMVIYAPKSIPLDFACPHGKFYHSSVYSADPTTYPVNKLRNEAIRRVRTTHFLMLDIDMWPASNVYSHLVAMSKHKRTQGFFEPKNALIIPVFSYEGKPKCEGGRCETMTSTEKYSEVVPQDWGDLRGCVKKLDCHIFDHENPSGHFSTDYKSWAGQSQYEIRPLQCFHSQRYEPYIVLNKCGVPKFDERFTGYGKNKIQHLYHLRWRGFRFAVAPRVFLTHVPHDKSTAFVRWIKSKSTNTADQVRAQMDELFTRFTEKVRQTAIEKPLVHICGDKKRRKSQYRDNGNDNDMTETNEYDDAEARFHLQADNKTIVALDLDSPTQR